MNRVSIQLAETTGPLSGSYDVLVNGDHYMRYTTKPEAQAGAVEASGGNAEIVDYTGGA